MINNSLERIRILRYTARIILLIVTTFWFVFALLSGAEQYGGGLKGIIMNSPNAIPWVVLYLFNLLTWKFERIGGIFIIISALFMTFAFDVLEGNWAVLLFIVVPLLLLGTTFIYCSREKASKH